MLGFNESDLNNANLDNSLRMETIELLRTACAEWRKRKRVEKSKRISLNKSRSSSSPGVSTCRSDKQTRYDYTNGDSKDNKNNQSNDQDRMILHKRKKSLSSKSTALKTLKEKQFTDFDEDEEGRKIPHPPRCVIVNAYYDKRLGDYLVDYTNVGDEPVMENINQALLSDVFELAKDEDWEVSPFDGFRQIFYREPSKGTVDFTISKSSRSRRRSKASMCVHGRWRYTCKDCGTPGVEATICEHRRRKYECRDCGGAGLCEHGSWKTRCKDCCG